MPQPPMERPKGRESIQKGREGTSATQDFSAGQDEMGGPPNLLLGEAGYQAVSLVLLKRQDSEPTG